MKLHLIAIIIALTIINANAQTSPEKNSLMGSWGVRVISGNLHMSVSAQKGFQ